MKTLALILFTVALVSCKTTNNVSQEDLQKAAQFAQCAQGCYKQVYGTENPDLVTP